MTIATNSEQLSVMISVMGRYFMKSPTMPGQNMSGVNAAKVVNMHRNDELRRAVLSADVILADGMPVVWASRLLRKPLPERVAGIDLFVRLLERANERGYRVYCLGATDDVLESVVTQIRE